MPVKSEWANVLGKNIGTVVGAVDSINSHLVCSDKFAYLEVA